MKDGFLKCVDVDCAIFPDVAGDQPLMVLTPTSALQLLWGNAAELRRWELPFFQDNLYVARCHLSASFFQPPVNLPWVFSGLFSDSSRALGQQLPMALVSGVSCDVSNYGVWEQASCAVLPNEERRGGT